ncbi:cell wall hydrolase [Natroniella sulfidigena]|uniref:cell wall hydrolase n=1 Tax=Natroniella sulfidigena TaxID=723921 RepID=UPI00200A64D0|nr:cell wall hydrolase [Natroniella sulfidigena]MCK8817124.1 cell wall hydrolase [Natroniella sulfidigena]
MKKLLALTLVLLLIGVGTIVYYGQTGVEMEESHAGTPSFWSLSPEARLMARVVYSEARGEPFLGQVSVAAVIMNRVESDDFPNTISGVIYQPWAFTPVMHGLIWNVTPGPEAVRATVNAYNGWDPTYGSEYFYNPDKITSYWVTTRETVRRIGKHVFAR